MMTELGEYIIAKALNQRPSILQNERVESSVIAQDKIGMKKLTPRNRKRQKIGRLQLRFRYSGGTHISSECLRQIAVNYGRSAT
jgi:hypothetical protein